jgi:predicted lysophospholipase L1 biosynthesis ABC-type transport system permease subunit
VVGQNDVSELAHRPYRPWAVALLRTVGSLPGQLLQVIGVESIIVGLLASAVGLALFSPPVR